MPDEPKHPKGRILAAIPEGPEYLMAYKGGFKGGLVGGLIGALITLIVCLICHYVIGI
jgi:hypothetical protein